jgi:two-component system OmpR family response regulator/two-component system alkaline phosphatase synthesis response regulator PhoP
MKRVLLVEDDLDIQRVYFEKLSSSGYEVLLASDGPQALTLLKDKVPNLILLDIMLPGEMNGFEILEMLKKNSKYTALPVVVLTNLDTERENAFKIGADDYLVKANTDLSKLVEKVKKHIK